MWGVMSAGHEDEPVHRGGSVLVSTVPMVWQGMRRGGRWRGGWCTRDHKSHV